MRDVVELLMSHQSIRQFTTDRVPVEHLHSIVQSAQAAPTSSLIQAYTIIHITDAELRKQLAHLGGNQPYIEECPVFLVFCADLNRLKRATEKHGAVFQGDTMESFILATADASLAAQNALVAAESLGYGGVYIGGLRNNPGPVSELLELPEKVYPVFGMCLGVPAHNPGQKPRLPLASVLKENRYTVDEDDALLDEYDITISQYYSERTGGQRTEGWTQQMAARWSKEVRLHMRPFLEKQGFHFK
jgi:FMN reductase (NADPH)